MTQIMLNCCPVTMLPCSIYNWKRCLGTWEIFCYAGTDAGGLLESFSLLAYGAAGCSARYTEVQDLCHYSSINIQSHKNSKV